jgi:hypothetical protein
MGCGQDHAKLEFHFAMSAAFAAGASEAMRYRRDTQAFFSDHSLT